jgi:hypothetical protein
MDQEKLIRRLEEEIDLIKDECRARGKGIRAFQKKSLRSLESAAIDLETINPSHPDLRLFDELLDYLEGERGYNPDTVAEIKEAQKEDEKLVKLLKKTVVDYRKAEMIRAKAWQKLVRVVKEYQLVR